MLRNIGLFLLSVVLTVTSVASSALGQQWAETIRIKTDLDTTMPELPACAVISTP